MRPEELLPSLRQGARILFVRLRSLGDTVLSTPLYTALKAWRPDLKISVLVESPSDEVLRNNPDIDQIISIDTSHNSLLARTAALRQARKAQFDSCVNLHGGSTSAWLTRLSGARYRVGLYSFRNGFAYNVRIEPPRTKRDGTKYHTVEYQMEWLRALGLPLREVPPLRVVPDPKFRQAACERLLKAGLKENQPYCVIQPTSKFVTKEWTPAGFAAVADGLQTGYGIRAVLVAGPGEMEKVRRVAEKCATAPVLVEALSIAELAWVIHGARLFIGNDSGPTHVAAALRVPVVVLFGSSDSQVWYPWKTPFQIVQNPFDCNPCPGYRCLVYDEPKCILGLTVPQVNDALARFLETRTGQPASSS